MANFFNSILIICIILADHQCLGWVGVNYGRIADNLPPPDQVVQLLKHQRIHRIKLFDTDPTLLTAFSNSNISLIITLPNHLLSSVAHSSTFSNHWVHSNISLFYPSTNIHAIAVGNEVFVDPNTTQFLIPAMINLYSSLQTYNLHNSIKISSPIPLSALASSYPPSSGSFNPDLVEPVIKPMLRFLRRTNSYLMLNAYPFFAYEANSNAISLDYALFRPNSPVVDSGNGLKYSSLFDAQLDAVYAAMSALEYDDINIVVTETGWPSKGDDNEVGASEDNAASYNGNLVKRVLTGNRTPLRPHLPLNVFLFALFNENQKPGPTSERNYGLFYPNEQKVYDVIIPITPLNNGSKAQDQAQAQTQAQLPPSKPHTWCVANPNVEPHKLQEALDYACGDQGGADCRPIQPGSTCYNPSSLEAHASYAFNSYYQNMARAAGSCYFGGAAYVVTQPPHYGKCKFPTGY